MTGPTGSTGISGRPGLDGPEGPAGPPGAVGPAGPIAHVHVIHHRNVDEGGGPEGGSMPTSREPDVEQDDQVTKMPCSRQRLYA